MRSIRRVLWHDREEMPAWLANHEQGGRFPRKSFFRSRVVYYPCSGTDGHAFETFGKAHAAHCFVHADWRYVSRKNVRSQLCDKRNPDRIKGYQCLTFRVMPIKRFIPADWVPTFAPEKERMEFPKEGGPFAAWAVLKRDASLTDSHGPERISLLHIGYEYVAVFERLFCIEARQAPYAVVFDTALGNWTGIGGETCLMRRLLSDYRFRLPTRLLVATHVKPWDGYRSSAPGERCHSGAHPKMLYTLNHGVRQ